MEELKNELQNSLQQKNEAEVKLGRLQGVNDKHLAEKQVYEGELAALRKEVEAKEDSLEQVQKELKTLQAVSKNIEPSSEQLTELLRAKQQINDLLMKNQQLQEEALKSQQEIGEVMVSAKKEANRIVNEAKVEAKHLINSAELEMLNIGNRAKSISNEVEASKVEVLEIYRELEERLTKLTRLEQDNY